MQEGGDHRVGLARRQAGLIPFRARLVLAVLAGVAFGLGIFTFFFAEGYSYFLSDPHACVNCHVMRDVYDAWNHGSHKAVATCNDCHTPHNVVTKYATKGLNGWNHSVAFTLDNFREPIRATDRNRRIALDNCYYCHGDLVAAMSYIGATTPTNCLTCHSRVGHDQ